MSESRPSCRFGERISSAAQGATYLEGLVRQERQLVLAAHEVLAQGGKGEASDADPGCDATGQSTGFAVLDGMLLAALRGDDAAVAVGDQYGFAALAEEGLQLLKDAGHVAEGCRFGTDVLIAGHDERRGQDVIALLAERLCEVVVVARAVEAAGDDDDDGFCGHVASL